MATIYRQICKICGHVEEAMDYRNAVKKLTTHAKKHKEKQ